MPEQMRRVNIAFTEEGDRTRADAVLEPANARYHGFGQARRAPEDPGEAAERIERFEGRLVKVHG